MPISVRLKSQHGLRDVVAESGLSQAAIASRARISPQRLNQLLNGPSRKFGMELDSAESLEDALNVPRGSLFGLPRTEYERARPYLGDSEEVSA